MLQALIARDWKVSGVKELGNWMKSMSGFYGFDQALHLVGGATCLWDGGRCSLNLPLSEF